MASYINGKRSIANNVTFELPGNTMTGETDPNEETKANFIGQLYLNTSTGRLFYCASVDYEPTTYGVWEWLPVVVIDDDVTASNKVWSSAKINSIINQLSTTMSNVFGSFGNQLNTLIDDSSSSTSKAWSASKLNGLFNFFSQTLSEIGASFTNAVNAVANERAEKIVGSWQYNNNNWEVIKFSATYEFNASKVYAVKLYKTDGTVLIGRVDITILDSEKVSFMPVKPSSGAPAHYSRFDIYLCDPVGVGCIPVFEFGGTQTFDAGCYLQVVELA